MTDEQCPKEVTHSLMCYVYKVLRGGGTHIEADLGFEDREVFGKTKKSRKGFPEEEQ